MNDMFWNGFEKAASEHIVTNEDVNRIRNWADHIIQTKRYDKPEYVSGKKIKEEAQYYVDKRLDTLKSELEESKLQSKYPDSKLKAGVQTGLAVGLPSAFLGGMFGWPKGALIGSTLGLAVGGLRGLTHDPKQHAEKHRRNILETKKEIENFSKTPILKDIAHSIARGDYDYDDEFEE